MKVIFIIISVFLFFSSVKAKNVVIPDAAFKKLLIADSTESGINTNGDGEIQMSEAKKYSGAIRATKKGIRDL
ncbi:MAG: hypothetical protein HRT72_07615 [Flavobacteriales bacterium]|nr:hypothetical protein [Flavobacteriales bacterium]